MNRRIFLIPDAGGLSELVEQRFNAEDVLQKHLSDYPDLLAGDQMNEEEPRRWLLVTREVGVPDRLDGSNRWSLDHLFLDQDGVPTLVEVKRSTDTRIRREVVAQMLDYAANGIAYWPVERLQSLFEADCDQRKADPQERLADLLGEPGYDEEAFWKRVKTNLQAGRIRMVFVADEIPPELRRIVEFLNEQMDPAEVLAVAIRQYVGEGVRTLVPQLIGQTAEAQSRKGGTSGNPHPQWHEASFFAKVQATQSPAAFRAACRLYEWVKIHFPNIWWGKGVHSGSCFAYRRVGDTDHCPIAFWTYGTIEIQFQVMVSRQFKPFDSAEKRRELLDRLNRIDGIELPVDSIGRRPSFPVGVLDDDQAFEQFKVVLTWYLEEVHQAAQEANPT